MIELSLNTTNYNLIKSNYNETADIEILNDNFDIIDQKLKINADSITNNNTVIATKATDIDNARLTSAKDVTGSLNELFTNASNGKTIISTAITGKGGTITKTGSIATNQELANGIGTINKGQGVAVENQVRNGVTFSNQDGTLRTGTIPTKTAITYIPTITDQIISTGFEDGTCKVKGDINHISANIKAGITDFGVVGKASVVDTADATATASHLLVGDIDYVNGVKHTGTMVNQASYTTAVSSAMSGSTLFVRVPQGAYLTNTASGYP